jgi:hypothetical protein
MSEKKVQNIQNLTELGYKLLLTGLSPIEVTIKIRLSFEDTTKIHHEFMALKGLQNFEEIYVSYKDYMPAILQIIDKIKYGKFSSEDFNKFCKYIEDIPAFERKWYEKLRWDKYMPTREDSSTSV